jgi:hypothetical protein
MATTTELYGALGTQTILMTNTNLSALANNALFLSADYNNVQGGGGGGGDVMCRLEAILTMATGATANTGFSVWFLKQSGDASTYERGGTGYTPLTRPDAVFPAPTDTTQTPEYIDVPMPAGHFKVLLKNDGTGQALKTDTAATGSQLSITPYTRQNV